MIVEETARKIKNMEIRGAGKIAVEAVKALKEFALHVTDEAFDEKMKRAADVLLNTRPTAVSLYNAIRYVMGYSGNTVEEKRKNLVGLADEFIENVKLAHKKIGMIGARRIEGKSTVMTHCNSKSALSIIREAHKQGKIERVFVTESRPRRQGLITLSELDSEGIETAFIVDSAVRYYMRDVDYVIVGADSVTANGAVINKIGTSQIALSAHEARVPVIVAAETYKFSPKTLHGERVIIEERSPDEVLPEEITAKLRHCKIMNPAFDATPREYIDLIVTEIGAIPPEMAFIVIRDYLKYALDEFRD